MGVIQIDETIMNAMNYRCAAAGPNIKGYARSSTIGATKIRPTSSFHVTATNTATPAATPTRTTRRPRSDSNASCDSSNSWAPRRTKNRKQNHNHNHNKALSSPRRKPHNNKNQKRTALHEKEQRVRYVAMDCEMVGIGLDGKQSIAARVTIIDWDCKVLLDTFVKPTAEVTDYRTFVSGIAPENLVQEEEQQEEEGSCSDSCCSSSNSSRSNSNHVSLVDIESCRQKVLDILKDKVLVGHALKNDLHALNITHPWYDTRDTAKYEPFMKVRFDDGVLWPRKLKDLVDEKLKYEIQISGKPHSAYEDAKAALDVYRCAQYKWEKAMEYKIKKTKQIMEQQQQQQIKQ